MIKTIAAISLAGSAIAPVAPVLPTPYAALTPAPLMSHPLAPQPVLAPLNAAPIAAPVVERTPQAASRNAVAIAQKLFPELSQSDEAADSGIPTEFSKVPSWFDASRLHFDYLSQGKDGQTVILRYGWRSQFEMAVFGYPDSPSVAFKEYADSPMGHPKRSLDAAIKTPASRMAIAKILREADKRDPVKGHRGVLIALLAFLEK